MSQYKWDAWAFVGTILATAVALFLPQYVSKKEWARQDRLRTEEQARSEKAKNDVIHDVCSTVDRILAYRKSAMALFGADNVYHIGFAAMERIHENTKTLLEMLEILKVRSELTDGAVYVAVSSKRIAEAIISQTVPSDPVTGPNWNARLQALEALETLAPTVDARNLKVRQHAKLNEKSEAAELILQKYIPLAEAIRAARVADSGAPLMDITNDHY